MYNLAINCLVVGEGWLKWDKPRVWLCYVFGCSAFIKHVACIPYAMSKTHDDSLLSVISQWSFMGFLFSHGQGLLSGWYKSTNSASKIHWHSIWNRIFHHRNVYRIFTTALFIQPHYQKVFTSGGKFMITTPEGDSCRLDGYDAARMLFWIRPCSLFLWNENDLPHSIQHQYFWTHHTDLQFLLLPAFLNFAQPSKGVLLCSMLLFLMKERTSKPAISSQRWYWPSWLTYLRTKNSR